MKFWFPMIYFVSIAGSPNRNLFFTIIWIFFDLCRLQSVSDKVKHGGLFVIVCFDLKLKVMILSVCSVYWIAIDDNYDFIVTRKFLRYDKTMQNIVAIIYKIYYFYLNLVFLSQTYFKSVIKCVCVINKFTCCRFLRVMWIF